MGLHVSIFRSDRIGDCTLGGISGLERNAAGLCLVNVDGPFDPSPDYPAAMLVEHFVFGDAPGRRLARIVPAEPLNGASPIGPGRWAVKQGWAMFGGNYAASSDSRFWQALQPILGLEFANGAVPIHDRYEG